MPIPHNKLNLVGSRFGRLVVIEESPLRKSKGCVVYRCKCDCGVIRLVSSNNLRKRTGSTQSCGCLQKERTSAIRLKDLTGATFGRLTVLHRSKDQGKKVGWFCICTCGKVTTVAAGNLTSGTTQSCGCLMKERASEAHLKDLTGNRYGKLVVVSRVSNKGSRTRWLCLCDCGMTVMPHSCSLTSGDTRSCGCIRETMIPVEARAIRHTPPSGHCYRENGKVVVSSEYTTWCNIKSRIFRPTAPGYENYGGRGLGMDLEWSQSFAAFYRDMGPKPGPEYSIERLNNDLGYFPGNCVWADAQTQANNKRPARPRRKKTSATLAPVAA